MKSSISKYLMGLWILSGLFASLEAQEFTNAQRREINMEVYSLINKYARYGKFSSNYTSIDENYVFEFRE